MNCEDCGTEMEEKWEIPPEQVVIGGRQTIKRLYQCPKCKRIDVK